MKKQNSLKAQEVKRAVESFQGDILTLLDKIVGINSYSHNTTGVAQVAQEVSKSLPSPLALENATSYDDEVVWICRHSSSNEPPILLVGHLDTVFPPGSFDSGVVARGPHLLGPGVADMKGGVVVILGALWVLDRLGFLPGISLILALNGDEEIGSPRSSPKLVELARTSRLGLVFEFGGPEGSVVTSRRGLHRYRLEIHGEAGHSGTHQGAKTSAVVELAHQILKLEALNDPKAGISLNVGQVKGGTAVNIIPAEAEAELEVRFFEENKGDEVEEKIRTLIRSTPQSKLKINLTKRHGRPPMTCTPSISSLYRAAARTAKKIDLQLLEEARGGASDANFLGATNLPTLDGLGPVGEMDHSKNERILKNSLFQRVELLVHLLWDLRSWTA
ncbi:MAG: M20 family metallopeptidase [Deltaproteobacteria bacterium]|nr:M20 family metallopeptidase [Deltaproteobacteria bacterium]